MSSELKTVRFDNAHLLLRLTGRSLKDIYAFTIHHLADLVPAIAPSKPFTKVLESSVDSSAAKETASEIATASGT
jgi:hypothetical protein